MHRIKMYGLNVRWNFTNHNNVNYEVKYKMACCVKNDKKVLGLAGDSINFLEMLIYVFKD
jgi:hypothetical protein